jgi:hypothetical protein
MLDRLYFATNVAIGRGLYIVTDRIKNGFTKHCRAADDGRAVRSGGGGGGGGSRGNRPLEKI